MSKVAKPRLITIDGETLNLTQWATVANHGRKRVDMIESRTISDRLRRGWQERDAVFAPKVSASASGRRGGRASGLT